MVIGCSLAKAVLNAQHLEQIRDGVERTHRATVLATELLNLHARRVLEDGEEVPDFFSGNWAKQAWVAVSTISGKVGTSLQASRQAQVDLHGGALAEVDAAKTGQLFKFAADQFASTAATNLQLHLRKRVGAYVNMSFAVDKDAWAAMARTERHAHKLKKRRLHWDVCRIDTEARKLTDAADTAWVDATRTLLGFDGLEWADKPLEYHARADPRRFLRSTWTILGRLGEAGWRGFSLLPLRRGLVPKYATVDTRALRDLLGLGTSDARKRMDKAAQLRKQAASGMNDATPHKRTRRTPEELADEHWEAWDAVFDLSAVLRSGLCGRHPQNRRGLAFGFSMTTDGVGCSLKFTLPKSANVASSADESSTPGKRKRGNASSAEAAAPRLGALPSRGIWPLDAIKHLARAEGAGRSEPPSGGAPQDVAAYLDALLEVQVVGVDPGKTELAVATDPALAATRHKIRTVRYTAAQRRMETTPGVFHRKARPAIRGEDHGAERAGLASEYHREFVRKPVSVASMEQTLSSTCASVASSVAFGSYVSARAAVLAPLLAHYAHHHHRRHRWRHRRESERSVARFVSQLKSLQRDPARPVVVAWGAWGAIAGRPGQPVNRGSAPCIGVGLMRRVARDLPVVKTPEYCTSKTCCRCGGACGNHATVEANRLRDHPRWRAREIRGLRLCQNSECRRPLNRDANAAVNIGTNLMCLLYDAPLVAQMSAGDVEMTTMEAAAATAQ